MATRYNHGSHYENHTKAAELREDAEHSYGVGEHQGKQDHLTGNERSRQALEHRDTEKSAPAVTVGHGIPAFGHHDIEALAYQHWQTRGCPLGSPDEDWFLAVEELRSRAYGR